MNRRIAAVTAFVLILAATTICAIAYFVDKGDGDRSRSFQSHVTDFDSCMRAGNPVQESYPRRCSTTDGRSYTEIIQTEPVPNESHNGLKTISEGSYGGPEKAEYRVVTTQADLDKLWSELQTQTSQAVIKPTIDFSNHVVIGVFAGSKNSGGHNIRIEDVTSKANNTYAVRVIETEPGRSCITTTSITNPYHIVQYTFYKPPKEQLSYLEWAPPTAGDFKFVTDTKITDCSD